jgi:type I restriction enzyme S subunit
VTELPTGWSWTTLGFISTPPQYGWTTKARVDGDGLKLLRTTDITRGPIDWPSVPYCTEPPPDPAKYLLAENDIVISRAGSVGASARVRTPVRAVFASYLIRFRPIEVDAAYVEWFLKSPLYWDQVGVASAGIALQNVNAKKLAQIRLPLPPLAEQRRIVAAIEEQLSRLDAARRSLSQAAARARRAKMLILNTALSDLQETVPLSRVAEVRLGRQRSPKDHSGPSMRPYLRAANVTWDGVRLEDVKEMNFTDGEAAIYELRRGDVLLAEASGSASEVGKPVVWQGEIEGCCFQNTLIRVRTESELPEYLRLVFLRAALLGQFAQAAPGVGIHHLGSSRLSAWPVPVLPQADQEVLVARVERAFSLIDAAQARLATVLARADQLRRAILAGALRGELAPQDPDDEPASVILEQIAAERAAAPKRTRKQEEKTAA